jgi:hypothetical protein
MLLISKNLDKYCCLILVVVIVDQNCCFSVDQIG